MAGANITRLRDQFSCSVCLDLFNDPVGLSCGHSFCMVCINKCWDQGDQQGVYSCPQCRKTFSPRPAVCKNTVLAEVVETLKNTRLHDTRPAECSVGPEDIECDSCTENKSKAIKSCLMCLASFCETHLQPHYKSPAFKKHKLVEASSRLQEQICSQHDKLLEVYCRTDQRCICMLCTMDEHKGHNTVSVTAGRAEKQKQMLNVQGKFQQKIKERVKELQELTNAVESHKHSAQAAVQETVRIFTNLIKSINKRCSEGTALIRAQENTAVSRAEKIIEKLEQEIVELEIEELKRRDSEMEEISHEVDLIHFLQHSAEAAVQETERIFTNLIESINKRCSEVTALIRAQENTAVSRAEKIITKLEQEIVELKRRDAEMEKLSHEVDHIHFLQSLQPLVTPPVSVETQDITINSLFSFEDAVKPVSQLQEKLEVYLKEQIEIISTKVNKVLIHPPHYREDFLQYSCHLKLDPNTAHKCLQLSDSNRRANNPGFNTHSGLYEYADRFESYYQVLCSESVCKPSYWEVEWNRNYGVSIAVSYKNISRKGSNNQCVFGGNENSWSLLCNSSAYTFLHNNQETKIPVKPSSSKIGVFVDYKAGNLSFYNVSNTMTLIHKVNTTFTQPLYPGFGVNYCSYVQLCNKK